MARDYLPHTALSLRIDSGLNRFGEGLSFVWFVLLAVIVCNVTLRYAFSQGRIELEELQWHLYSIGFLLGMSYAYQADAHIRVDVLHENFRHSTKAWIELYGIILLLLPFIALILVFSVRFVESSWAVAEISMSPGGLPLRWLIKAALPVGFSLLLLSALSRLLRVWYFLFLQPQVEVVDAD
ncbi:MAG: TRAP transporter small permease subunit [Porticoccaceae bacterium]|nr:TRAP transporter small permease subunit [Porticoccaceae bacterium]